MQKWSGVEKAQKPRKRVLLALAWYSIAIHRGITRFAHEAGWIVDGGYVREGELPAHWKGDGVIAVMGIHPAMDRTVAQTGLPIVNIGYMGPRDVPSVAADSAAVGKLAAEHFLTRGFRHFAFYETRRLLGEVIRRDGFEHTLLGAGHRVHRIGIPSAQEQGVWTESSDREFVVGRQLLDLPKPVAVTAEYDDLAIEVIDAALAAGLRVPEQVAVLGVDNDELRCPFAPVPLSSIDNDEDRIGYEAAKQLQRLFDGKPAPTGPVLIPPRRVIVRQSTNVLAIQHEHVATALRMIWEHYTEAIDATRLAADIPLSYTQLHESFMKHVGHSMAEELERRRIEHAQRLLSTTDVKMVEVARKSGFGSADRMGRVFQRRLHVTPSEYRKQIADGTDLFPQAAGESYARPAAFHQITKNPPKRRRDSVESGIN